MLSDFNVLCEELLFLLSLFRAHLSQWMKITSPFPLSWKSFDSLFDDLWVLLFLWRPPFSFSRQTFVTFVFVVPPFLLLLTNICYFCNFFLNSCLLIFVQFVILMNCVCRERFVYNFALFCYFCCSCYFVLLICYFIVILAIAFISGHKWRQI